MNAEGDYAETETESTVDDVINDPDWVPGMD